MEQLEIKRVAQQVEKVLRHRAGWKKGDGLFPEMVIITQSTLTLENGIELSNQTRPIIYIDQTRKPRMVPKKRRNTMYVGALYLREFLLHDITKMLKELQ